MKRKGRRERGTTPLPVAIALGVAVPLWIERVRDWPAKARHRRALECAQWITMHGDKLNLGRQPRQGAVVFNSLAEGLACLAFEPGGVRSLGLQFNANKESFETMTQRYPVQLVLQSKEDEDLLREGLLVMRTALTREWEQSLTIETRRRLDEDIRRVERMLEVIGYTALGPRRW